MGKRVLIIGGGVSGLACAAELAQAGCDVTLLEAQDRLGGRILMRRSAGQIVELGAEFVHGRGHAMMTSLRDAGLELSPVSDQNRIWRNGKLVESDIWTEVGELFHRIDQCQPDQPFADFLEKQDVTENLSEMATGFVEGFNASDAAKISAHSLLRAEFSSEHEQGDKQAHVRDGYDALIKDLERRCRELAVRILLGSKVRTLKWQTGNVVASYERDQTLQSINAECSVTTLPLGILKAGLVQFDPVLHHKQPAIDELQFGNVIKCVLVFRRACWPEENFGFIHDFSSPLPTWWSDSRGPVVIGWAAGPRADSLLQHGAARLEEIALDTLAKLLSVSSATLRENLASFHCHNWAEDENVRGSYSYIPVNGLDLPKLLGAPVEETLFFAGEATATDAQMGTVSGALETAKRAAKEIVAESH